MVDRELDQASRNWQGARAYLRSTLFQLQDRHEHWTAILNFPCSIELLKERLKHQAICIGCFNAFPHSLVGPDFNRHDVAHLPVTLTRNAGVVCCRRCYVNHGNKFPQRFV